MAEMTCTGGRGSTACRRLLAIALQAVLAIALGFACLSTARAEEEPTPEVPTLDESFDGDRVYTLGPLVYRPARGVRFGDTGLTIGGFATLELDAPAGSPAEMALDGPNFLIQFQPFASLRVFAELEMGDVFEWEIARGPPESSPVLGTERLYAEWEPNDAFSIRFGKYQTPVGRWNLVPAEPFVWTATQPVLLEVGLGEESLTGPAISGTFYPGAHRISYWLFGQVVDSFDLEADEDPPDRGVGARIEYGEGLGVWSVGASVLTSEKDGDWSTWSGVDFEVRIGSRLELTSEFAISRGDIPGRDFLGVFVEASYRLDAISSAFDSLYWVTRVEHFEIKRGPATQVGDLGFAWLPKKWLILKAGYRLASEEIVDVTRGFIGSASVVF